MNDILRIKVVPDLPLQAKMEVRAWRKENKHNDAFHKVIEQLDVARCRNCGDYGQVLVSFTKAGPFRDVPNHKRGEVITWFDGDGESGKGWYVVVMTKSYECHHCDNEGKKTVPVPDVGKSKVIQQEIEGFVKGKSVTDWWEE